MKSLAFICAFVVLCIVFCSTSALAQKRRAPIRQPPPKEAPATLVKNCPGSGLSDAEVADLLAGHNKERQKVGTPPLRWDCTVGALAAGWAKKGTPGPSGTDLGENIFVASDADAKVTRAIDQWEDEAHHWKNKTGACESGKACTHYTQMVWRSTTKIGCAINRNLSGRWKLMLVCNYDPEALSGPAY